MKYPCNKDRFLDEKPWTGELTLLQISDNHYEAVINARGSYFHIITGRYENGYYLCVPNHNFGCELAGFSDKFWNREHIKPHFGPVDTETLVCALESLNEIT